MQHSILLIWAGAILVLCGVVFAAAKALGRGRLSEARGSHVDASSGTLEPRGRNFALRLKASWPGLVLILAGALLLLMGAS